MDDNRVVGISLKTIIEASKEIDVTAVGTSGFEAVKQYDSLKPDILLTDIRMEGITGLDAGERILHALRVVMAGQSVFGEDIVAKIPSLLSRNKL